MPETLRGRVALVTGGTGALGRSVVAAFADEGAVVHVPWLRAREVGGLKPYLDATDGQVHLHQADVTDPATVARLVEDVTVAEGRLDILANVVGGFTAGTLVETDPITWQKMFTLNATSAFLCTRAVVPHMRRQQWGRIINIAAGPALDRGAGGMSAYAASKAAVLNLTYSLSKELVRDGITVNAIVPSVIDTHANRAAMPKADVSTWLEPQDIARVMVFLASEDAAIVTGSAIALSRG
jgi:NAD(P)-dependent dehydrogenase (short-subunit alcohol dehydrogenase family)